MTESQMEKNLYWGIQSKMVLEQCDLCNILLAAPWIFSWQRSFISVSLVFLCVWVPCEGPAKAQAAIHCPGADHVWQILRNIVDLETSLWEPSL